MSDKFEPKDKKRDIKGKDYLDVKWRLVWLRNEVPNASIDTVVIQTEPFMLVRAELRYDGQLIATGHGTAPAYNNGQSTWKGREIEKAETAAIGRALAHAGYGTQFMENDDEDLADAPVERNNSQADNIETPGKEYFTQSSTVAVTKNDKNGNPYITIERCAFFSREPFRALGYDDNTIDMLGRVGANKLPDPVTIVYTPNDKGFRDVLRMRRDSTGEVVDVQEVIAKAS